MNRCVSLMAALASCGVVLFISGCGGGGYGNTQSSYTPPPVITVLISPSFGAIDQGQSVKFTATTDDSSGKGVNWSLSGPGSLGGTTNSSTTYQAPSPVSSPVPVTLTATSVTNPADFFSIGFNVVPPPMIVTSPGMPDGNVGTPYAANIPTMGGTTNFTFAVTGGALPLGLAMDPSGFISGTPTFPVKKYNFTVMLTDGSAGGPVTTSADLSINIGPPLPLVVTPSTPPVGTVGFPYSPPVGFLISTTGGVQPYTFSFGTGSNALPLV